MSHRTLPGLLMIAVLMIGAGLPACLVLSVSAGGSPSQIDSRGASAGWSPDEGSGAFVFYGDGARTACQPATEFESRQLNARDPFVPLRVIATRDTGFVPQMDGGLHIVLRGTPQLDAFPQAKDGFLKAAASWETLVHSSVTIIIDVDFGPTRFGQPFGSGVLGGAASQSLFNNNGYDELRNALIAGAGSADELALYDSLPQASVPTDIGATTGTLAPSALLRALGLINPVADPDAEPQFGAPPSIGFNSGFQFDFDPDDGIDADKIDFDAVATHEIGHVLGFTSRVGARELDPSDNILVTGLDLFRFRPGAGPSQMAPASFSLSQRILSSGGEQVFFAGGEEVPLSTGRPDGTGGDGFQAGHWKDSSFVGASIGIMDPALANGERGIVTQADMNALDAMGYGGNEADAGAPTVKYATLNEGATLAIKGKRFSPDDIQIEVNFTVISPPLNAKVSASGKKIKIKGDSQQMNLHAGANQVRVIQNGLRSNVVVLNL